MTENEKGAVQDVEADQLTFADSPIGQILWATLKDAKEMYEPLTVSAGDLHCALATLSTLEQTLAAQSPPLLPVARDECQCGHGWPEHAVRLDGCHVEGCGCDGFSSPDAEILREANSLDDYANEVPDRLTESVLRSAAKRLRALASRSVPPAGERPMSAPTCSRCGSDKFPLSFVSASVDGAATGLSVFQGEIRCADCMPAPSALPGVREPAEPTSALPELELERYATTAAAWLRGLNDRPSAGVADRLMKATRNAIAALSTAHATAERLEGIIEAQNEEDAQLRHQRDALQEWYDEAHARAERLEGENKALRGELEKFDGADVEKIREAKHFLREAGEYGMAVRIESVANKIAMLVLSRMARNASSPTHTETPA